MDIPNKSSYVQKIRVTTHVVKCKNREHIALKILPNLLRHFVSSGTDCDIANRIQVAAVNFDEGANGN